MIVVATRKRAGVLVGWTGRCAPVGVMALLSIYVGLVLMMVVF